MPRKPVAGHLYIEKEGICFRKPTPGSRGVFYVKVLDAESGAVLATKSTRTKSFNKALRERERIIEQFLRTRGQRAATMAEAAKAWLEEKRRNSRPTTLRNYESVVTLLSERIGRRSMRTLKPSELQTVVYYGGVGASQQRQRRSIIHGIFKRYLRDEDNPLARANPASLITVDSTTPKERLVLGEEELQALVEMASAKYTLTCKGKRQGGTTASWTQTLNPPRVLPLALVLMLQAGLRARNVLNLTWNNMSLDERLLRFSASEMKSRRPFRLPMHADIEQLLRQELEKQGRLSPNARVLADIGSDLCDFRKTLRRLLGRFVTPIKDQVRKNKILQLSTHDLRHHFCTRLGRIAPLPVLVYAMDHSAKSAMAVTGRYTHVSTDDVRPYIERLPSIVSKEVAFTQSVEHKA